MLDSINLWDHELAWLGGNICVVLLEASSITVARGSRGGENELIELYFSGASLLTKYV